MSLRRLKITAQADRTLGEVIPILYLTIPRSQYAKAFNSVKFTLDGKLITVYSSGRINLGCVLREEIALRLPEKLKTIIAKAYEYHEKHGTPDLRLLEARMLSIRSQTCKWGEKPTGMHPNSAAKIWRKQSIPGEKFTAYKARD